MPTSQQLAGILRGPVRPPTIALLHFDNIGGAGTTILDVYNKTTWFIQTTGKQTAISAKWGAGGYDSLGLSNGEGVVSNTAFASFPDSKWTVEAWFNSSSATSMGIFEFRTGTLSIRVSSGNVSVQDVAHLSEPTNYASSGTNYADGVWHFIEVINDGSTLKIYVDNVLKASGANTRDYTGPYVVAWASIAQAIPWKGYLDDCRLSAAALTPALPTGPFVN